MKKKVIIGSILGVLILVIGGFIVFRNMDTLKVKETVFTFEMGERVPFEPKYYLKDSNSKKVIDGSEIKFKNVYSINQDNKELKTDGMDYLNAGTYEVIISYKNKNVSFAIKVEDTTKPEFENFKEEIVLEQNSLNVDLTKFYKAKDLTDVTIVVSSDYDLSKVGEYIVTVKATDQHNNTETKESKIKIIKYEDIKDNELTKDLNGNIYKSQKRIDEENKPKEQHNNSGTTNQNNNQTTKPKVPANNSNTNNNSNKPSNNNVSVATYRRDIAEQYVKRINQYRVENGLSELPVTSEAQAEADMRSKQIVDNYGHNSSYGFGENIGRNVSGFDFVEAWKNSWSHKNAMLREQNTAMAVSIYEKDGWWYAVTSFRMNY